MEIAVAFPPLMSSAEMNNSVSLGYRLGRHRSFLDDQDQALHK